MDDILTSTGRPFKAKAAALKAITQQGLEGYEPVEIEDGVWVVRKQHTPLDVICPGCGQSYHETTEHYDPGKDANLAMLRLKQKYREWGWEELPPDQDSGYGCLVCPECGAVLAPSGRLRVRND